MICETLCQLENPTTAPSLAAARGPLRWELPLPGPIERETDPQAQPAPDNEFYQSVARERRLRQGFRLLRGESRQNGEARPKRPALSFLAMLPRGRVLFLNGVLD